MTEQDIPEDKRELMIDLAKAIIEGSSALQMMVREHSVLSGTDYSVLGYRIMHEAIRRIMRDAVAIDLTNIKPQGNA